MKRRLQPEEVAPDKIALTLLADPDFTAKGYGRKVRALGGDFDEARGSSTRRHVSLPWSPEARALVAELIPRFSLYEGKKKTGEAKRCGIVVFKYGTLGEIMDSRHNGQSPVHYVPADDSNIAGLLEALVRLTVEEHRAGLDAYNDAIDTAECAEAFQAAAMARAEKLFGPFDTDSAALLLRMATGAHNEDAVPWDAKVPFLGTLDAAQLEHTARWLERLSHRFLRAAARASFLDEPLPEPRPEKAP